MIEVFKTNVQEDAEASRLLHLIHQQLTGHRANFDLEDQDNILRVQCKTGLVESSRIIGLVSENGFFAEVLTDDLVSEQTL